MKNKIKLFEGDNLLIAQELIDKKTKVDVIYLDLPYNTKSKNVSYHDNFEYKDQEKLFTSESLGWIKYMLPRLKLAKKLLKNQGFIAISIGSQELGSLKIILDKIFGRNNEIAIMPRVTNMVGKTTNTISKNHDFLLIYGKTKELKMNGVKITSEGYKLKDKYFNERGLYQIRRLDYKDFRYQKTLDTKILFKKNFFYPGKNEHIFKKRQIGNHKYRDWCWIWSDARIQEAIKLDFIEEKEGFLWKKTYLKAKLDKDNKIKIGNRTKQHSSLDFLLNKYSNGMGTRELKKQIGINEFSFPKPSILVQDILNMSNLKKGKSIILDMFAGTGVTGVVAIKKKINAILIQNSEKIIPLNNSNKFKKIIEITLENLRIENEKNSNSHIIEHRKV